MAALEVKAVEGLAGSGFPYAYAVKAGPFIFLTGHEAFDHATGSTAAVDGPPGFPGFGPARSRREADFIFARMRKVLQEFGTDLANGLRLDQYYPGPKPVISYQAARHAAFGKYIPPSTSVVMERCFGSASTICSSLIAVMPDPAYRIEPVYPKKVGAPTHSGFVPTITCNDFIFVAGQMATGDNGDLDPAAHVNDQARWGGSEIRKQTDYLIEQKLRPAVEAAGSSLEQSLKAQIYVEGIDNFPDSIDAWTKAFARIPCAVTVVPTKSFGSVGGIIEINLIALKADAKRKKEVIEAKLPDMASYGPAVKAGEFLFPSGLMAIGPEGAIAGSAVSPGLPGLAHAGYVQASAIYGYADALAAAAGTSMKNLLRAQYFVGEVGDFAGIGTAWASRYGAQPHPFLCVGVPKPLPAPGAAVIADFWIYCP